MASFPPGYLIGHAGDSVKRTGCTVILPPAGTIAAVDVRGGAPGTRETGVFTPGNLVSEIHGLVFTGGSAFGLAAAQGVTAWLKKRGTGFAVGPARVPIVAGAVLFDLAVGDPEAFPDESMGLAACEAAREGEIASGAVGAGSGATVGKLLGIACASRGGDGFRSARALIEDTLSEVPLAGANTTLVCVATTIPFDQGALKRVAIEAHDGLARAVRPAHTIVDGDVVFALAPGGAEPPLLTRLRVAAAAAEAASRAILVAVQ